MHKEFLKVYQIYYGEHQKIEPRYIPYYNRRCTIYFENSVIESLINKGAHKDSEYFGVVSHKLREKVRQPFMASDFECELIRKKPDVFAYNWHRSQDPLLEGNKNHKNFYNYFMLVANSIGLKVNRDIIKDTFYSNHFVAKSEIYEEYVKTVLTPAMELMDTIPELMEDSGYPNPVPGFLPERYGINHYPYHPFICERLFTYFVNNRKLTVGYYK